MARKTLDDNVKEALIYGANIVFPFSPLNIGNALGGFVYGTARLAEKIGKVNFNSSKNVRLVTLAVRGLSAIYYAGSAISEVGTGLSHRSPHMILEGVMSASMAYELGKEFYQQI